MTNLNETNEAAREMLHELHAAMGRDLEKLDSVEDATEQAEMTIHILLGFQYALDFIGNGFVPRAVEAVGEEVFGNWVADSMRARYMARLDGIDKIEDEDMRAEMLADLLREAMSDLN